MLALKGAARDRNPLATPSKTRREGSTSSAAAQSAPTARKPSRPSPGMSNVRPTSGVTTRMVTARPC